MQKAYADFAATQTAESTPTVEPTENASMAAAPVVEAVAPVALPEVVETLGEIAGPAIDAMTEVADELQTTAASQVEAEPVPQPQGEPVQASVSSVEAAVPAEISEARSEVHATDNAANEQFASDATSVVAGTEENSQPVEARANAEVSPAADESRHSDSEGAAPTFTPELSTELSAEAVEMNQHSGTPHNGSEPEAAHHATEATGNPESEITASTAAAWASWRNVRETGTIHTEPPSEQSNETTASIPEDSSAMAVAAGAEHHAEDVRGESEPGSAEIASIVDSVLADLRPKIFEEISRKLGKKK